MKPAGRLLGVLIRANRLDAGAPILSERLPEAIADIGVASAGSGSSATAAAARIEKDGMLLVPFAGAFSA